MLRIYLVQIVLKHPANETEEQTLVKRHVPIPTPIPQKNSSLGIVHRNRTKILKNSKIYRTSLRNKLSNSTSRISSIRSHRAAAAKFNAMEGQLVIT